jgi:hypothetical protein
LNYDVFKKFYIVNDDQYLIATKLASLGHITEDNFCEVINNDKKLGKVFKCTCVQGAKLSGTLLGKWVFASVFVGLLGALWV